MTRIAVRHTCSALVVAALVFAFASGPVSASGAILVVTAADGPMPKAAGEERRLHLRSDAQACKGRQGCLALH